MTEDRAGRDPRRYEKRGYTHAKGRRAVRKGRRGGRRRHMVVEAAMLVAHNDQQRLGPCRAGDHCLHDLPHQLLAVLHVGRRAVAVSAGRQLDEVRVDERHTRETAYSCRIGETEFRVVEGRDIRRIESVPLEESQEGVVLFKIFPRDVLSRQVVEDRRRE